jgi:CoA:oxalate CoA-transferase
MVEKDPNDRNDRVLAGLRVVELGRHIAGPFCAQMLGDAGADVIKVESPRGDPGRLVAPFAGPTSLYFVNFNRNKRSIALDLRTAEGRGILVDLIAQADVFVHNYRPGVVEQLGVDVAALHDVNPGLIGVGISGFGREGPYAEQPAYDDVLQAMSGLMSLTGFADGPPLIVGAPIIDCTTGLYAFTAVLLGLAQRSQTGKGSVLSVSMLDCAMSLVNWSYSRYLTTGEVDNRSGNQNRYYACIGTHRTRDGYVQIIADTDAAWRALAELMGRSDLAEDGRLRTAEGRADAKDEVAAAIDDHTSLLQACNRLRNGVTTHLETCRDIRHTGQAISWLKQATVDRVDQNGDNFVHRLSNSQRVEDVGGNAGSYGRRSPYGFLV